MLKWERYIKKNCGLKQLAYFELGFGAGLQPMDLQKLKWEAIHQDENGGYYINVKTKYITKIKKVIIPPDAAKTLEELRKERPDDVYIFQSESRNQMKKPTPWSLNYIRLFLSESALKSGAVKADAQIGSLTLRKSYGYFLITKRKWTIRELQRELEMRTAELVIAYIGLTDEPYELGISRRDRIPRKSIDGN